MSSSSYPHKRMWLHCTVKCSLISSFKLLDCAGHCLVGDTNMTNCRGRGKGDSFTEKHDSYKAWHWGTYSLNALIPCPGVVICMMKNKGREGSLHEMSAFKKGTGWSRIELLLCGPDLGLIWSLKKLQHYLHTLVVWHISSGDLH